MPLAVTRFSSTDAGAPQINSGLPSEIINVLRKCLVDGYGTQQPLGWTVAFEDGATFKIAFKNREAAGGSGGYVRFWAQGGSDTNNANMYTQSANGMSGINDLFQPGPQKVFYFPSFFNAWELIGCGRAFYLFLCGSHYDISPGSAYCFTMFAGDIDNSQLYTHDPARFITISAYTSESLSPSWQRTLDYGLTQITKSARIYALDGANEYQDYYLMPPFGPPSSGADDSEPVDMALLQVQLVQFQTGAAYTPLSDRHPGLRGFLPGLWQSSVAGYSSSPWPTIRNLVGENFWLMRSANYRACFWLNLESWYE